MSQANLTEDERAAIGLAQDIEMAREEAGKWATLEEHSDKQAMEQIAGHFKDVWQSVMEDAAEQSEQLDIDEEALRRKLSQPPANVDN